VFGDNVNVSDGDNRPLNKRASYSCIRMALRKNSLAIVHTNYEREREVVLVDMPIRHGTSDAACARRSAEGARGVRPHRHHRRDDTAKTCVGHKRSRTRARSAMYARVEVRHRDKDNMCVVMNTCKHGRVRCM
jgi:hypothetical protein